MNIRKFIGATSRDALRLVREALGADAVVLSNRTNEDGTVEIVAVADTEFAAIAPASNDTASSSHGGYRSQGYDLPDARPAIATPAAVLPAAALPPAVPGVMAANPYASGANGMPDVFSAVFGASPEVGANGAPATDAASVAAAARSRGETKPMRAAPAAARPAAAAPVEPKPAAAEPAQTMAESNPWLIDHAQRIAAQQQRAAHTASPVKARPMTPAAAAARGLGATGKILSPDELLAAETPDWAQEAADVAARRAIPRITPAFEGLGPRAQGASDADAAAINEAVRARIEEVVNQTVMNELSSMRGMMEEQFAGLVWAERQRRNPVQGELTKQLFAAGFSAQLVRTIVDRLPEQENVDAGMEWVQSVLATNLPVLENEDALMERGGVFALMGPTGVGKTTTTAKLAARCVMRFGASKVALLTTDSYRIGGHEQLRIFGKILGVSVHAVKDAADLQLALTELRNKHIVLIDTIGMSQRDRSVSDQIAMLCGAGLPVQRLLLLNATSHADTLNEVVQAYRSTEGQPELAGCILTKLDEATNLGGVLDTVIRYKLPVHYVSTGQKVPENLYVATKKFLIKSAFCIPRGGSPFVPHDDDIPALLSSLSSRSNAELHEVRFG
ncbi:flagellar biosynthesis protein FlhF [Trinickia caryophylli]|uniref:Flagellar biosynthesis protein FlhF n=1 Tax=Trinickia caryophylli TaxID=28094 RepID=A0A1X7H6E6_TRICW|nr:flagellar biosynthesis protein FlhF [Trinickia caryophylli]PMS13284.1 flagellar biosynthesis protein FlhF [Trinickia caryophylli]TRX19189.1 flagellar biosynthesis protein FlhF [Trinickia caryophylli]WQE13512.1 flagellar biosynthesis protein FlhF [Trinickia caryophylli]SMF80181.1 flagellar biosynthesis protein FlhF [Trinickia caryophylli]GLU33956.1 flagellar biosynthesis regulator FlhF [Trinickia caryophylli]